MSSCRVKIDTSTLVIEMDPHARITLRCFDYGGIERGAADRIDEFARVAIVGGEMQIAGFVVDHPAAHGDRVLQNFIGDAELLKRVNAAHGKREIDRPPTYNISFAR